VAEFPEYGGVVCGLADDGRMAYIRLDTQASPGMTPCSDSCTLRDTRALAEGACGEGCAGGCGRIFAPDGGALLLAENSAGARIGDHVFLAARSGSRLRASALLFAFPLLIFLTALILGYSLFDGYEPGAFGLACLATALYYLLLRFFQKRKKNTLWIARVEC
jgi:positive regulator of sigma E activity